jgi:hypothetical protein
MANPFSSIGISDRDYKAAVAAIAGEMGATAQQDDVDRVLDSIANRAQRGNRTLGQVVTARGQYDAMRGIAGNRDRGNKRTNGGQKIAREAFRTALAPSRAAPAVRDRIAMANQAIENVLETGWSRGIAQGATDYRNVVQTDKWGTGKGHRTKEARYGYVDDDTGHRFTGTGMWQDRTYDPVSLHGMLTPPDTPPPVDIPVYGPPMPGGYTPAPRDAYTVQPQGITRETFDQIYEGMPAYEAPATFDERYAPSGPMPPGSFGDFLGSYGNDHLIGADFGNSTPTGTVEDRRGGRPGGGGLHPGFQPDLGGIDLDRIEQAHSIWNEDRRFSDVFSAMPYAGISAPLYGEEAAFPTKEQSFFPMSLTDWGIGPETGIPPAANWEKAAAFPHPENFDRWDEDNFSAPVWGAQQPASAGFFNAPLEQPTVSPTQFSNAYTAPMTGPASMAYGVDIGQPAPEPFAPEPAPDWFSDRLAEPSLYGSSFGLDTAMAGSRTSPTAPGRLGSEITPEYTAHVPEAARQTLDSFPDYDHLGAPPMGGYTPPAPTQDYTAPPSMLASMDIGGSTADRLRSPSGYGSDYMTPGYARDEIETGRDRLAQAMAERFGATAAAAIPQAPPQAPPRAPDPVSRFTERTVYDTKMVPEKYTVDVPVERSFSKANVGTALGAKPTGFADLGFMSGLMTGNPWSDSLHQKAQNVTQPQSAPPRAQPQSAPPQMRREERTRMVEQRTPRTIREVVKDMQPPTRPAMARPEVPSFTRPVSMQEMGINPIGAGSWGFNAFEPPAPSISQSFSMAGNSLLGGLSDSILSGLGYGPDSSFTGGWGGGWGEGGPGGYGGGSVYDGNSGPYAGGDARFDGGWGGLSDGDTYR